MKADIKQQWLEALRSGKYKQGKEKLAQPIFADEEDDEPTGEFSFCCLGVLCVSLGMSTKSLVSNCHLDMVGRTDLLGAWGDGEFSEDNPDSWNSIQKTLAGFNDSGKTFAEIADWIEANVQVE